MRVRLSGSTITAHGDNLASDYVEFPGNEPLGFPTNWTIAGSSPNRVLKDPSGHEFARELPTQTVPAPDGGGSISATGTGGGSATGTALQLPGTVTQVDGSTIGVGLLTSVLGPYRINFNSAGVAVGIKLVALAAGTRLIGANCRVVTTWDNDADLATASVFTSADPLDGAQNRELFRWLVGDNWFPGNSSVMAVNALEVVGLVGPNAGETDFTASRGGLMTALGAAYAQILQGGSATQGAMDIELIVAAPAS